MHRKPDALSTLVASSPLRYALWISCILLVGCGGGGSSGEPPPPTGPAIISLTADHPSYFVGDVARLTAVFQGGSGRIDPGGIAVSSGQAISTSVLKDDVVYTLTVSNGAGAVSRSLPLEVNYRDRMRAIPMPFARQEHEAVALPDGRVLIIGGDSSGSTLPADVYQFDPATESFSRLGALETGRVAMVATALANGDVLVALGGQALSQASPAEILNARTGATTPTLGNPHHPRYHATATLLADGRVLIAGGFAGEGADPTAEIFDPTTSQFILLASRMAKGRYSHTATRLDDGRVLIYGGHTNDGEHAPPELFDPAVGTFTALAAPEIQGRALHSAVKTRDGRVWIVGGEDRTSTPLATVLRFDPETLFALAEPRDGAHDASRVRSDGRAAVAFRRYADVHLECDRSELGADRRTPEPRERPDDEFPAHHA